MHQRHYDIIILGDSLAARLAGTLLAKTGKRVLTFTCDPPKASPWLFNSDFLNQAIDQLGARQCLVDAPRLQVISGTTRLEINGHHPLAHELQREFPHCHQQLTPLLQQLEAIGKTFETRLWEHGGLPVFDFSGGLKFRKQLLLHRISLSALRKPLQYFWRGIQDPDAQTCLRTLFSGLAMQPLEMLSLAEGALLWHDLCQPRGIAETALSELLTHRYEQFHGSIEPLSDIDRIDSTGRIQFKNGRTCSSNILLLGHSQALKYFAESTNIVTGNLPVPTCWRTTPIMPGPASILAPKVILGEVPLLRLSFTSAASGTTCITEAMPTKTTGRLTESVVGDRISEILPFSAFDVTQIDKNPGEAFQFQPRLRAGVFPGRSCRLKIEKNMFLCFGEAGAPNLGCAGEILVGISVARYLAKKG